jgi:hypothetical protein
MTAGAQAAVVVGDYSFAESALVDQVSGFSGGGMYTGSGYVDPVASPANITDTDSVMAPITFLSTAPYTGYDSVSLDLNFSKTFVQNGPGADLALFFLFDQSSNQVDVTINGTSNPLSFSEVFGGGTQQVANGVVWNGETLNNVLLLVAELDLGSYGIADGGVMSSPLSVAMNQLNTDARGVVALSMVGALNTTPIPIPAAVWMFGSGLIGLVGIARRRRA